MSDPMGLGDAVGTLFAAMFIALCISVPLGIWKLVEIIIWLCHHVHFGVTP